MLRLSTVLVAVVITAPLVGVVPTTTAATASRTPAVPVVTVDNGELTWVVETNRRRTRAGVLRRNPCLELTSKHGVTDVCVRRHGTARVQGAFTFRIPARLARRTATTWTVTVRQADLMMRPGRATAASSCAKGCARRVGPVRIPALRFGACQARRPWLVHGGPPEVGKAVALTFDDGPGAATRRTLRILRRNGVSATFFELGLMVKRYPDLPRRVQRRGHALGNHSYGHPLMSGGEVREITRTQRALRRRSGTTPCLFRAPYGSNPPAVVDLARSEGLVTVHWNVDPGDWRGSSTSQILATVLRQTRRGSIMVFHDSTTNGQMLAALPLLIRELRGRGFRFLTVPELLRLPVNYR